MSQVVTFIQNNGHLLFSVSRKGIAALASSQSPKTAAAVVDDYDYVNLESRARFDQDNEEVKRSLPHEHMKRTFDVLVRQSASVPDLPECDKVSPFFCVLCFIVGRCRRLSGGSQLASFRLDEEFNSNGILRIYRNFSFFW